MRGRPLLELGFALLSQSELASRDVAFEAVFEAKIMYRICSVLLALVLLNAFSLAVAQDSEVVGKVDFPLDGGTLRCKFGSKQQGSRRHVALIVHPATINSATGHKKLVLKPGTAGSAVVIVDSDGTHRQLDPKSGAAWAKERITDMASRSSSIAEKRICCRCSAHAFHWRTNSRVGR